MACVRNMEREERTTLQRIDRVNRHLPANLEEAVEFELTRLYTRLYQRHYGGVQIGEHMVVLYHDFVSVVTVHNGVEGKTFGKGRKNSYSYLSRLLHVIYKSILH